MHHLLNSLRPHQARATLIDILELQIQRRREAVEDIKRKLEDSEAAEHYCAEMGRPALQVIEALKNNDVGRFREMLLEQQTSLQARFFVQELQAAWLLSL
ncbi:hypothetical protein MKW98_007188 [Papaver atlanticum]|uniref:Mediator of RNA polymerase II transcription subunit 7 n=1 Tax=Papaver atlanticum TaxID=357466 RepID=A0AAD4SP24_9MAGN|nr:hypothetical protein MKW98_007188 [Papaver atlanticum]